MEIEGRNYTADQRLAMFAIKLRSDQTKFTILEYISLQVVEQILFTRQRERSKIEVYMSNATHPIDGKLEMFSTITGNCTIYDIPKQ